MRTNLGIRGIKFPPFHSAFLEKRFFPLVPLHAGSDLALFQMRRTKWEVESEDDLRFQARGGFWTAGGLGGNGHDIKVWCGCDVAVCTPGQHLRRKASFSSVLMSKPPLHPLSLSSLCSPQFRPPPGLLPAPTQTFPRSIPREGRVQSDPFKAEEFAS